MTLFVVALVLGSGVAHAQEADPADSTPPIEEPIELAPEVQEPPAEEVPVVPEAVVDTPTIPKMDAAMFGWDSPSVEDQVAADNTEIPPTYGSVFVPSLALPSTEPEIRVLRNGKEVAKSTTAKRVPLAPGEYTVLIGSGTQKQMLRRTVTVRTGKTTVIPVTWSGLRVSVVDASNQGITGRYEVFRQGNLQRYGTGFGAAGPLGEATDTWLLPPGLYRIVRSSSDYRSQTDFLTVYLPESGLTRFTLVQNNRTGKILGGGVVPANALGLTKLGDSNWSVGLTMGADGSMAHTINVPGIADQRVYGGNLFLNTYFNYKKGRHFANGLLEMEEGFLKVNPEIGGSLPITKSRDEIRFDASYTYFASKSVGPYARFQAATRAFQTNLVVAQDSVIAKQRLDGGTREETIAANDTFRVANAFSPTQFRESGGVNYAALRSDIARVNLRTGLSYRQNIFRNTFVQDDIESTPQVEYRQVGSFNQLGLEGGLRLQANFGGRALLNSSLTLFSDFLEEGDVTVEWKNTLGLRISDIISLEYSLDLIREPQVTGSTQLEQGGVVRLTWTLL